MQRARSKKEEELDLARYLFQENKDSGCASVCVCVCVCVCVLRAEEAADRTATGSSCLSLSLFTAGV